MAIKIKIPGPGKPVRKKSDGSTRPSSRSAAKSSHFTLGDPVVKIAVSGFLIAGLIFMAVFAYFYVKYSRIVDRRMAGPIFSHAASIYARPKTVSVGEPSTRRRSSPIFAVQVTRKTERTTIRQLATSAWCAAEWRSFPGRSHCTPAMPPSSASIKERSAPSRRPAGKAIRSRNTSLEPVMVTGLFEGSDRTKQQLIKFDDLPKDLVNAIIAIEDRRFFQHNGVNYYRLLEAGITDIMHGHRTQGGSTLTMQLSRGFFLTPEKTMKRKITEMVIAMDLEQKFSKQQIFQMYANQVPLGQRGSYSIMGVGEAARGYFNKDVKNLTLPECALIAGIIQRPSYLSPYRHPERALERRNLVLDSMVETGAITRAQAESAKATPLKLAPPNVEASDAPYFVDLVKDQLSSQFSETDLNQQALRIYTTIDPDLQKAAVRSRGRRHEAGGRAGHQDAHQEGEGRRGKERQGRDYRR